MIILFIVLFLCFFSSPALASDITVTCPNDPNPNPTSLSCTLSPDNIPLFDEKNIAPGFITTPSKLITVDNLDTGNPCFLEAQTIKKSGSDLLLEGAHRLNLSIISNSSLLYSGPLIFSNLNLDKVDIGSSRNYYWTISFPQQAGNDYQALSANFDINLNFTCADNPTWQPPVINPQSGLYLSEYMPRGAEWVEIFNNNTFPVILDGWHIDDDPTAGQSPILIPYANIAAKSFYVLELGSGFLNDTKQSGKDYADYVVLINDQNIVVESTWYSTSSVDLSWSKQTDGSWCQTTPSKGTVNNPCPGVAGTSTSTGTVLSQTTSSPPVCNDAKPATPTGLLITTTLGAANLSWTPISPPITSYLIAYGPTSDNILYGNPNIGLSTNYTVGGLTPGAAYCFYVRAQNGCMPGDTSETVCINPGSNIPIVETEPPAGFQPEVLGETTDNSEINQVTLDEDLNLPDILGDTTSTCTTLYIPILFILAFILNILIFLKNPQSLFLPFLISLTTFVIDYLLLQKFCCRISILCRFYFIGNIASFFIPKIIFNQSKK